MCDDDAKHIRNNGSDDDTGPCYVLDLSPPTSVRRKDTTSTVSTEVTSQRQQQALRTAQLQAHQDLVDEKIKNSNRQTKSDACKKRPSLGLVGMESSTKTKATSTKKKNSNSHTGEDIPIDSLLEQKEARSRERRKRHESNRRDAVNSANKERAERNAFEQLIIRDEDRASQQQQQGHQGTITNEKIEYKTYRRDATREEETEDELEPTDVEQQTPGAIRVGGPNGTSEEISAPDSYGNISSLIDSSKSLRGSETRNSHGLLEIEAYAVESKTDMEVNNNTHPTPDMPVYQATIQEEPKSSNRLICILVITVILLAAIAVTVPLALKSDNKNENLIKSQSPTYSAIPSFQPSSRPISLTVAIQLDRFPEDTGWGLTCNEDIIMVVAEGEYTTDFELVYTIVSVPNGADCQFTITDGFGNGIEDGGYYRVYIGDDETRTGLYLAEGGVFDQRDTTSFTVKDPFEPTVSPKPSFPTTQEPSQSPVPSISPSHTNQPSMEYPPCDVGISLDCDCYRSSVIYQRPYQMRFTYLGGNCAGSTAYQSLITCVDFFNGPPIDTKGFITVTLLT